MGRFRQGLLCLGVGLACMACGEEDDRAPLLRTVTGGNASSNEGGMGGGGGGGESTGTGGSATGDGGTSSTVEKPDHPLYFLGESDNASRYVLCDAFTGELVATVGLTLVVGFTHPMSGHLVYWDNLTGEIRDAQTQETVGDCPRFSMNPAGDLVCGKGDGCVTYGVDELGNLYCHLMEVVVDPGGVEHTLSAKPPTVCALRAKKGGGFWAVGLTETGLGRWSIAPDGTLTFEGDYANRAGVQLNYGCAIDEEGAAYSTARIGPSEGGIVRFSADFKSTSVTTTDTLSDCKVREFNGAMYSTP
jgi:hypothetical protein